MRTRTPQQGRIQDFSEGGAPYEKWGGGGGGQFASGPILWGVITAKIHTPYSIIRGGGGASEVWGGGGASEVWGGGGASEVWGGGGVMQCYRLWQGKSKFHSILIPISCHTVGNQSFSIVGV